MLPVSLPVFLEPENYADSSRSPENIPYGSRTKVYDIVTLVLLAGRAF